MGENTRDLAVRAEQRTRGLVPADAAWQNATLVNGWVNYGAPYAPVSFRKDGWGFVHLRGLAKTGPAASVMFTLPAGYRPAAGDQQFIGVLANGAMAFIEIGDSVAGGPALGDVYSSAAGTSYVSLNGVTFLAGE